MSENPAALREHALAAAQKRKAEQRMAELEPIVQEDKARREREEALAEEYTRAQAAIRVTVYPVLDRFHVGFAAWAAPLIALKIEVDEAVREASATLNQAPCPPSELIHRGNVIRTMLENHPAFLALRFVAEIQQALKGAGK